MLRILSAAAASAASLPARVAVRRLGARSSAAVGVGTGTDGPQHETWILRGSSFGTGGGGGTRLYSASRPLLDENIDPGQNEGLSDKGLENKDAGIYAINTSLTESEIEALIDEELALMEAEAERKKYPDWRPGQRKRPLQMSHRIEDFEREFSGEQVWTTRDKRCGALGVKLGMVPVWDAWGERHACTVLHLDTNVVIRTKTSDGPDGYDSVVVGAGERRRKNVSRALLGTYDKLNVGERPPYMVREFRVTTPDALPTPGTTIHAAHFVAGQNIDVTGISKGKGFQGAMKRHNFAGMPATHGTSKSHRVLGSTGQCQDPGKVFKGKKMAGRMGTDRVTVQNLRIVKIDRGRNLLYVGGAVPGNKGTFVEVRDAIKRPLWGTERVDGGKDRTFPPLPTAKIDEDSVDGNGETGHEVMMPLGKKDPFDPDNGEMAA